MSTRKPMRLFSINLTGEREFYVSHAYRELPDGDLETTGGVNHDITADVRQWLVKAQRDMAKVIQERVSGAMSIDEIGEILAEEIAARE